MNSDILYQIGNQIDDHVTFFNFIISFKNIRNKEALIKQKKQQFTKIIISYHKDGQIRNICYMLPNFRKEGLCKSWYENRQLYEQYNSVNGKKGRLISCIAKLYRHRNGQLHKQYNYINDKIEGLYHV
jgi:antitoxin component YwqK of YwqJK toxin-antitoxin module